MKPRATMFSSGTWMVWFPGDIYKPLMGIGPDFCSAWRMATANAVFSSFLGKGGE